MSDDNARARTHLTRLGVNPVVAARLEGFADEADMTLREFVQYVLSDYVRHAPRDEEPEREIAGPIDEAEERAEAMGLI